MITNQDKITQSELSPPGKIYLPLLADELYKMGFVRVGVKPRRSPVYLYRICVPDRIGGAIGEVLVFAMSQEQQQCGTTTKHVTLLNELDLASYVQIEGEYKEIGAGSGVNEYEEDDHTIQYKKITIEDGCVKNCIDFINELYAGLLY